MHLMTFDEAVEKGTMLYDTMRLSPESSQLMQSQFKTYSDLKPYGWQATEDSNGRLIYNPQNTNLLHAYMAFQIPTSREHNIGIVWNHDHQSQHPSGSPVYPSTGALYDQAYNVPGHTIFANILQSPASDLSADPEFLPPLQHWSDVTYLQWADLAPDAAARRDLRRVIQCNIDNDETMGIVEAVFKRSDTKLKEWPGTVFIAELDDGVFKALLATPHARGTAYMLAQRKGEDEMGWRDVKSITIWKESGGMYMMMEIGESREDTAWVA